MEARSAPSDPSWPSLYDLGLEIVKLEHHQPTQPGGHYLYNPRDVFRFTLYWTLIFYTPAFLFCGTYAFLNLTFPPARLPRRDSYHLHSLSGDSNPPSFHRSTPPRTNEGLSRLTFALLVFFIFLTLGVGGAVIAAAIGGYILVGLFKAANFNMSTWIPLIWVAIQVLVGLLGIWPSVIDII